MRIPGVLLLLLTAKRNGAHAAVQTNALFSDGMVLQTAADAPLTPPTTLYGTAAPNEKVTLAATPAGFPGAPYTTSTSADGTWSIVLKPDVPAGAAEALGGAFTLTLSGSDGDGPSVTAKDVVFGDVYLCSGQSNM